MGSEYHTIEYIIGLIDAPNRTPAQRLFEDNEGRFRHARGSSVKHQAWEGGYIGHIEEISNMAIVTYPVLNEQRNLPFTLSDALLVLYLHDIEKPWLHQPDGSPYDVNHSFWKPDGFKDKAKIAQFGEEIIDQYGFQLTEEHKNGLKYVEGENHDYHPTIRRMGPLAAFCHAMDVWSARMWHNYPQDNDPWKKK